MANYYKRSFLRHDEHTTSSLIKCSEKYSGRAYGWRRAKGKEVAICLFISSIKVWEEPNYMYCSRPLRCPFLAAQGGREWWPSVWLIQKFSLLIFPHLLWEGWHWNYCILPVMVRVFLFGCFCVLTKVHNGQMHFPSVPVVYMVRLV